MVDDLTLPGNHVIEVLDPGGADEDIAMSRLNLTALVCPASLD